MTNDFSRALHAQVLLDDVNATSTPNELILHARDNCLETTTEEEKEKEEKNGSRYHEQ